jgi:superoxide dismutase
MSEKEKEEVIERLNQILQVRGIPWSLLPEHDLKRLFEAFEKLRQEIEEIFHVMDELQNTIAELPFTIEGNGWKEYTV